VPLTNIIVSVTGSAAYSQLNTCGTSLPANAQCTITVTFAPTGSGPKTGAVSISDSASNSPQTITLAGTGVQPLSLTPGALNFGSQTVGTTSAGKSITVTNHERVVVNFTNITIMGTNSSDFSQTNACSSLSPGTSCTVTVTFTPSAKGARNATLTLTDSATNSPQTAKLTGTGQ
jgi:hypothetical protein